MEGKKREKIKILKENIKFYYKKKNGYKKK